MYYNHVCFFKKNVIKQGQMLQPTMTNIFQTKGSSYTLYPEKFASRKFRY